MLLARPNLTCIHHCINRTLFERQVQEEDAAAVGTMTQSVLSYTGINIYTILYSVVDQMINVDQKSGVLHQSGP